MTTSQPWPEGVIARCLTLGGATVDVIDETTDNGPLYGNSVTHRLHGACTGERCPETYYATSYCFKKGEDPEEEADFQRTIRRIQAWAHRHAAACRWLPRAEADR